MFVYGVRVRLLARVTWWMVHIAVLVVAISLLIQLMRCSLLLNQRWPIFWRNTSSRISCMIFFCENRFGLDFEGLPSFSKRWLFLELREISGGVQRGVQCRRITSVRRVEGIKDLFVIYEVDAFLAGGKIIVVWKFVVAGILIILIKTLAYGYEAAAWLR